MNEYPTDGVTGDEPIEAEPLPSHRRRLALTAVVTSAVLVGGVIAGTQFAAADEPELEETDDELDESLDGPLDDEAFAAFDQCLSEQLGVGLDVEDPTEEDLDAFDAITDEAWEAAETACEPLLPDEVRAEIEQFAAFDACVDGQLGDLMVEGDEDDGDGSDGSDFGDAFGHGTVIVEAGQGDEVAFYDFGSGDGTITVTKQGDDVTVVVDGDVTTVDLEALEAEWEAEEAAWEAAMDGCGDLLPDGAGELFDDEMIDDEFDELDD